MLISSVKNYLYTLPLEYDFHTAYVTAMALSMFDQWKKCIIKRPHEKSSLRCRPSP